MSIFFLGSGVNFTFILILFFSNFVFYFNFPLHDPDFFFKKIHFTNTLRIVCIRLGSVSMFYIIIQNLFFFSIWKFSSLFLALDFLNLNHYKNGSSWSIFFGLIIVDKQIFFTFFTNFFLTYSLCICMSCLHFNQHPIHRHTYRYFT